MPHALRQRVSLLFPLRSGPYGGANQFLRALQQELRQQGYLEPAAWRADAVIANANPSNLTRLSWQLFWLTKYNPKLTVVFRLDGPIALVRGRQRDLIIDQRIAILTDRYADAVVFQSEWSREKSQQLFPLVSVPQHVILNAPDPTLFYPVKDPAPRTGKTKIIATSWSSNRQKGFSFYHFLDQHLDWNRYQMTFIGNSPIAFRNIVNLPPQHSDVVAKQLRTADLYLTASANDPCSNSLIEALACGLPAVALNSGGHPELVDHGGELFSSQPEMLQAIDLVAQKISVYQKRLPLFSLKQTAHSYLKAIATTAHERIRQR